MVKCSLLFGKPHPTSSSGKFRNIFWDGFYTNRKRRKLSWGFYFNWFSSPHNVHLYMVSSRPGRWHKWSPHAWEHHVSSISIISRALKIPASSERSLASQRDPSALHKKGGVLPQTCTLCAASRGSGAELIFEERGIGSWRRTPPPTVSTPQAWIDEIDSIKSKRKYEYKYKYKYKNTYKCN